MSTVNLSAFPSPREKICRKCNNEVTLYDSESSEYFVCPKCHTYLHIEDDGFQTPREKVPEIDKTPLIPLGTEGTLKGLPYKMIAYMEKKEAGTAYHWREYMLYNYSKGYAFLAEYNGHWSYIAGKEHFPDLATASFPNYNTVTFRDNEFSVYNKYEPVITGLIGEFDWDVLNERVCTREWILPPYLLVNEKNLHNKSQNDWYFGEWIEPKEIAEGFGLNASDFPSKIGVGANQPSPYYHQWQASSRIVPIFILAVLILGFLHAHLYPSRMIFQDHYTINLSDKGKKDSFKADSFFTTNGEYEYKAIKSAVFTVDNDTPLEFYINSNIDNNWTEADILLVNERTNQTWEVTKSIEYYHGYEDGESWSEGSTDETVLLSHIPKGKYHLNIYPYSGDRYTKTLNISAQENVTLWRNVFITILLLALYPLLCWFMTYNFEKRRWMNSDYSPYQSDRDNDD